MKEDFLTTVGADARIFEGTDISSSLPAARNSPKWQRPFYEILQGNSRTIIPDLPQVHCVVCSPPYFRQRKYGDNALEEIGQNKEVPEYLADLVGVLTSINLHPEGSVWVNIADKRDGHGGLLCIPERFVIAMAGAGLTLIDRVIWAKSEVSEDGVTMGNYAPEPCKGRLNDKAHEPFYRFTKSSTAWTDTHAIQVPRQNVESVRYLPKDLMSVETAINGKNLHTVWNVKPGQTHERHYAVFPPALCERPIAMTCPWVVNPDGSLPRRLVEMIEYDEGKGKRRMGKNDPLSSLEQKGRRDTGRQYVPRMPISKGWELIMDGAAPGIVLDPFAGTGTTGEVALKLGRSFIGIDLYSDYAKIARERCAEAMRLVEAEYGYDHLYESINLDQSDLKVKLVQNAHDGERHPHLASLFEENEGYPPHLR